nr:perisilin-4beta [Vazella pourtalesii]
MKSIFVYLFFSIFSIDLVCSRVYDENEKKNLLDSMNNERRNVDPQGSNMRELSYSDCLAGVADEYVMGCPGKGDRNAGLQEQAEAAGCVPPGATVGSAIYNQIGQNPVLLWAGEDYDYDTNSCGEGTCENYRQLMNAESHMTGCAVNTYREECEEGGFSTFHCYFINATSDGDRPYLEGEPCSECETSDCNEGLCGDTVPNVTTEPQVTTAQVTTPKVTTPCDHNHNHNHHNHGHGHNHGHNHDNKNPDDHKDDTSKTPQSDVSSETPKPHDHGHGHKSHDHNHGSKHDHAHNHHNGNGDMNGKMSVGQFVGSSSSASINKIAVLLLIASLFAFIFSSL